MLENGEKHPRLIGKISLLQPKPAEVYDAKYSSHMVLYYILRCLYFMKLSFS